MHVLHIKIPNICSVFLPDYKLHIIVVYRPPPYSLHDNNILIDFLSDFCINREVIVMGDFNLPSISRSLGVITVSNNNDNFFLIVLLH